MNTEDSLKEKLLERLNNEFKEYQEALIELPGIKVFNKSYEMAMKQEIPYIIENMDFDKFDLKALNEYKGDLLSAFYDEWIDFDLGINEVLEPAIDKAIRLIRNDYKKELESNKEL